MKGKGGNKGWKAGREEERGREEGEEVRKRQRRYREQHVLLVLVDSLLVQDGVCVLQHAHTLSRQDRLVYLESGGQDLGQTNVRWNFVTD